MIETLDPGVFIEDMGAGWIMYNDTNRKERWKVIGICNQCGLCEIGSNNPNLVWYKEAGEAYACRDLSWGKRRDIPVRPEIKENSRRQAASMGKVAECSYEFESL